MSDISLLGISGSLRADSFNRKLIREAARLGAFSSFTEANIDFPLYNGDVEAQDGVPEAVAQLSQQIAEHDAVVISTPEYNKGISGALKNALDWVSRTPGGPWSGKPVALLSATAGRAGGERAQFNLRLAMMPFRPRLLQGPELLLANASAEFNDQGHLVGDAYVTMMKELMAALKSEVALTR